MRCRIAILDDDASQVEYLEQICRTWAAQGGHAAIVSRFFSAEAFLFHYEDDADVDVLLLDIQMPGMDGVELARRLRAADGRMQIVFITGRPDYAALGYEVFALHYLMKPVTREKLFSVLDLAVQRLSVAEKSLLLHAGEETVRVAVRDVLYVEAFSHITVLHTKKARIETAVSLSKMEERLGADFARCHRSYIVGLAHIARIAKAEVILDDGRMVPLSRRLYAQVNQAFIRHFKGESAWE